MSEKMNSNFDQTLLLTTNRYKEYYNANGVLRPIKHPGEQSLMKFLSYLNYELNISSGAYLFLENHVE